VSGDGVQRTCPKCADLNSPNGRVCLTCGAWLIEPEHVELDEQGREDFRAIESAGGRRIVDPERPDRDDHAASDAHPWKAKP
jgi:hypothetical protein